MKRLRNSKAKNWSGCIMNRYSMCRPSKKRARMSYQVAAADFVTTDEGTGVVHTAVVYGEDDYNLGLALDLPVIPALDEKGIFNDTVPQFKGVYFKKADKLIIEDLDKRGLLFKQQDFAHPYPLLLALRDPAVLQRDPGLVPVDREDQERPAQAKRKDQLVSPAPERRALPPRHRAGAGLEHLAQPLFRHPDPDLAMRRLRRVRSGRHHRRFGGKSGRKDITDIHSHFIDDITWECQCGQGKLHRIKEVFDCWVESGSMSFAQHHYMGQAVAISIRSKRKSFPPSISANTFPRPAPGST